MGTIIQLKPKHAAATHPKSIEQQDAIKRAFVSKQIAKTRRKNAKREKERERAIMESFDEVLCAVRDNTNDWGEALEIGAQRMHAKAAGTETRAARLKANDGTPEQIEEWQGYAQMMQEAAQEYDRFAEIYAAHFKPIEAMLQAARRAVAEQIIIEFPKSHDAITLADHLWRNTPGKWLFDWDPMEKQTR